MYEGAIQGSGAGAQSIATTRHSSFVVGTDGKGANPVDTLLVGLCGCLGHYVRDYLNEHQLPAASFRVAARATPKEDRSLLARISVQIDLGPTRLGEEQERELLATAERCILYRTLQKACPVELEIARDGTVA